MMMRCHNPNHHKYYRYGGRGIRVCERWHIFDNFLNDMGERPDGLFIDRIDNDGDYTPDNCRWATRKQQQRNNSRNVYVSAFGKTMTIAEWAEFNGLKPNAITKRLKRRWGPERAVSI